MQSSKMCWSIAPHSQKKKRVCNSNDENPNKNNYMKMIPLPDMANCPVKNIRVEKGDNENWSMVR